MSQGRTSVADRHRFIDLKLQGHSLPEIAEHTGWSYVCQWWRRYRDGGRQALDPPDQRKQRGGPLSTFPGVVRFSFLRIKKEHPKWGTKVARPRVAARLDLTEEDLPCVSTLGEVLDAVSRPAVLRLSQAISLSDPQSRMNAGRPISR